MAIIRILKISLDEAKRRVAATRLDKQSVREIASSNSGGADSSVENTEQSIYSVATIHFIPAESQRLAAETSKRSVAWYLLCGLIAVGALTFFCFRLQFSIARAWFLYLIVIVLLSLAGDLVSSTVNSIMAAGCLTYFFAPPIFSVRVDDPWNIVLIMAFLTTSLVISHLISKLRRMSEAGFFW